MKKIIFIISSIVIGVFSSCTDDSSDRFGGDSESGWVQFVNGNDASFVFSPNAVYKIPVQLNSPVNTSGLDVNYTITNVVGTTAGIIDFNPTITYVPNVNTGGEVLLQVVAGSLDQNIEFDVTLTSTSRSNVTVGLGIEKPIKKRVKICSTNIATSYVGTSTRVGTSTVFTPWSPIITPVPGESNKFQFNTCWGGGFVPLITGNPAHENVFMYPGFVTINADNTVTVVGINSATSPNRYPGGTGTFDPCSKIISYRLNQGLFTNTFQVDVVLVPNN